MQRGAKNRPDGEWTMQNKTIGLNPTESWKMLPLMDGSKPAVLVDRHRHGALEVRRSTWTVLLKGQVPSGSKDRRELLRPPRLHSPIGRTPLLNCRSGGLLGSTDRPPFLEIPIWPSACHSPGGSDPQGSFGTGILFLNKGNSSLSEKDREPRVAQEEELPESL
jgi:hypothetical protein